MQDSLFDTAPGREVYTVARLNREIRHLLEGGFPLLWVGGEISNLSRPASGHYYFSLKDADAQVRCAMFRARNLNLGFTPQNGMRVVVRARVSLYEPRGDYQLIVEHMEEAGAGALRQAFEQLKQRLAAEGLFDTARKKELPALPRRIGVITSPTGAAVRDILSTLRRRFPAIPLVIYPVPVQGAGAAAEIARMIRIADARRECDVLILARGGGSLEDLWAFNEEAVARALHVCALPVVTGIGHEIDFTIADFVADRRAPTPTGAAELVSPNGGEWRAAFARHEERLVLQQRRRHTHLRQTVEGLARRLAQQHPGRRLRAQAQRLDELEQRLHHAWHVRRRHDATHLGGLINLLHKHAPLPRLQQARDRVAALDQRLRHIHEQQFAARQHRLAVLSRALDAVSPLATLDRGYAIVRRLPDRLIVRTAAAVNVGDRVETQLARGRLICTVDECEPE